MSVLECYAIQPGWSKSVRVVDMECKQVASHCYRPPVPPHTTHIPNRIAARDRSREALHNVCRKVLLQLQILQLETYMKKS